RHQHPEPGHRIPQARGIDGLVGEGADQGPGTAWAGDQGSRSRSEVRSAGSSRRLDAAALTGSIDTCIVLLFVVRWLLPWPVRFWALVLLRPPRLATPPTASFSL